MKTINTQSLKNLSFIATMCAATLLVGCNSTSDITADSTYSNNNPLTAQNGVVCEMEKPVGSHIFKRVCRTAQERANLQDESRSTFFSMQNSGGTSHAGSK